MKKRSTALLMAMALTASMAVPVGAVSDDNEITASGNTKQMTVGYEAANTFTVTIPKNITITDSDAGTSAVVKATSNIAPDKALYVSVAGSALDDSGNLVLTRSQSEGTAPTITSQAVYSAGNALKAGETILYVEGGNVKLTEEQADTVTLNFSKPSAVNDSFIAAGSYSATLEFTAEVKNKPEPPK